MLSKPLKNFPHFIEPDCSSPPLQGPDICPYPEPDQINSLPQPIFWKFILILSYHLQPGILSCIFSSGYKFVYLILCTVLRGKFDM
jgi:hypothetical protein